MTEIRHFFENNDFFDFFSRSHALRENEGNLLHPDNCTQTAVTRIEVVWNLHFKKPVNPGFAGGH